MYKCEYKRGRAWGREEGTTNSDILFRLLIISSVDFELLVDYIRDTLCVGFPLKTCSAL